MDLNTRPERPPLAQHIAQMLAALFNPQQKATIDAMIRSDTGLSVRSSFVPATEQIPAYYVGTSGDWTLIIVGGCSLLSHSQATLDGYRGGLTSSLTSPVNDYFQLVADTILNAAEAATMPLNAKVILAGHSLGGAAVECMLPSILATARRDNITLITFGAPKPGNSNQARINNIDRRARWMTSDDPVPLLPPTTEDGLAILIAYNIRAITRFGYFVQGAEGVEIRPDARIVGVELPTDAAINLSGSLVGWLLAVDGSSASGHHIATYIARFALWMQQHPEPAAHVPAGAPIEQPVARNTRLFTQQQRQVVNTITQYQERQTAVPTVIPPQRAFRVVRQGRLYLVVFNGQVITTTARRRTAARLARDMNRGLSTLQVAPIVNRDELVAQMTNYLNDASTAGNGFVPVMNTEIPT